MARNDDTRSAAPQTSPRWGRAPFRSAFGIALGVILAVVLVLGVLTLLFV